MRKDELRWLANRLADGEAQEVADFYAYFHPKVLAVFRSQGIPDGDDVELTDHLIFLRLKSFHKYVGKELEKWVMYRAYKMCWDYWRKQQKREKQERCFDGPDRVSLENIVSLGIRQEQDQASPLVDEPLLTSPDRDRSVRWALNHLCQKDVEIIEASVLRGESHTEIAKRLGLSAGNSRVRFHRGKKQLQAILSSYPSQFNATLHSLRTIRQMERHFVPLPMGFYLERLASLANVRLRPILGWFGIGNLHKFDSVSVDEVAHVSEKIGLGLKEVLVRVRLSTAGGQAEFLSPGQFRGSYEEELDAYWDGLEVIEASYDNQTFDECLRIQAAVRLAYAKYTSIRDDV